MSFLIELKIPDIGNFTDVDVTEVLIKPGDVVELEQTLLVLETDKASIDVPATAAGTIQTVHVKTGDKVSEGTLIATLLASEEQTAPSAAPSAAAPAPTATPPATTTAESSGAPAPTVAPPPPPPAQPEAPRSTAATSSGALPHASPAVRRFARELGVDLGQIGAGSGRKGRILKEDVKQYVKRALASGPATTGAGIPPIPAIDFSQFGPIEERPLGKIKRLTGSNLSRAWLNVPMVTQHEEADITELEAFRKALTPEQTGGAKITPLAFIVKALVATLQHYPQFNASLSPDGNTLILKKYYHIGIAVDTPNGLVVPVIKHADRKSLRELASDMAELSQKARQGKLSPLDMQGASMTISSLGGLGGTAFTPIVNAPEVAILGVSRAAMKPVWDGERFVPRLMLPLDLTYDHRVIDGAEGVRFIVQLAQYLSDIRRLLL